MPQNASAPGLEPVARSETRHSAPNRDPRIVSLGDHAKLTWYFGPGGAMFERSTFGAMIEALASDGFGSRECPICKGAGVLEIGGVGYYVTTDEWERERKEAARERRPEQGIEAKERKVERGGWCKDCGGTGSVSYQRKNDRSRCHACKGRRRARGHSISTFAGGERVFRQSWGADPCDVCLATGVEPINALPLDKPAEETGYSAGEGALERFAIVSRRVAHVRAGSHLLGDSLATYFGDIGERWAGSDGGRIFSLFAHTAAGKKLSRWHDPHQPGLNDLSTQERIWSHVVAEKRTPDATRRQLLLAAGGQAADLYGRTATAWNKTGKRAPDAVLLRLLDRAKEKGLTAMIPDLTRHLEAG